MTTPSACISPTFSLSNEIYASISALRIRRSYDSTLMPAFFASLTVLLRTVALNGTITSTSTPREIRFSICEIWRCSLASADCTKTLAPCFSAAAMKKSRSRVQRSTRKSSMEKPIFGFFASARAALLLNASMAVMMAALIILFITCLLVDFINDVF